LIKVCFFSGDITRGGGTERVSITIANELAKDPAYQVCFLSLVEQKERPAYEIATNISRHALGKRWLSPGPAYLSLIPKVRRFLKEQQIDLIIDIDIVLDVLSVPATVGLKTKVLSWEHSNCTYELTQGWYRRIILNLFTKRTDGVVTLTPGDAIAFQKHFKNKKNIVSIFNPASAAGVPLDKPRENWLITAARLVPEKGFDYLMLVAKEVLPKHPEWKWILCGDGPMREELDAFSKKEKLQEQLVLAGYVPKVEEYLAKSKIFVLTSKAEGLPMCLLEARACGVPCVSFDVPTGPADIITEGVNGYLIQPFDVKAMADKLSGLMEDPFLQASMGEEALKHLDQFYLPNIIGQWKHFLGELIK
jgi:glycosyltransferase involved in cell wall biosynthesis